MIMISAVGVLLNGSLVWFIWKNTNKKKGWYHWSMLENIYSIVGTGHSLLSVYVPWKSWLWKRTVCFHEPAKATDHFPCPQSTGGSFFFLIYTHAYGHQKAPTHVEPPHTHTIILFQASVSHAWVFTWPRGRQHICLAGWLMPPASQAGKALADSTFVAPTIQKHHSNSGLRSQGS